jgi:hypothetical protein
MSPAIPVIDPGDNAAFEVDWTEALAEGVTLSSVTHTVPNPLTKVDEDNDGTTSTVRVTGAVHGGLYMIEAEATLSTGETLNRQFPLRAFNG